MKMILAGAAQQKKRISGGGGGGVCTACRLSSNLHNTSALACADSVINVRYINLQGAEPAVNDIIYTDSGCSSPFDGNGRWWKLMFSPSGSSWAVLIADGTGVVTSVVEC